MIKYQYKPTVERRNTFIFAHNNIDHTTQSSSMENLIDLINDDPKNRIKGSIGNKDQLIIKAKDDFGGTIKSINSPIADLLNIRHNSENLSFQHASSPENSAQFNDMTSLLRSLNSNKLLTASLNSEGSELQITLQSSEYSITKIQDMNTSDYSNVDRNLGIRKIDSVKTLGLQDTVCSENRLSTLHGFTQILNAQENVHASTENNIAIIQTDHITDVMTFYNSDDSLDNNDLVPSLGLVDVSSRYYHPMNSPHGMASGNIATDIFYNLTIYDSWEWSMR